MTDLCRHQDVLKLVHKVSAMCKSAARGHRITEPFDLTRTVCARVCVQWYMTDSESLTGAVGIHCDSRRCIFDSIRVSKFRTIG